MKIFPGNVLSTLTVSTLLVTAIALLASSAMAQDGNRWYQIEVTVFAHENSNTLQEQWPTDDLALAYPADTRELDSLLKHLTLDDWSVLQPAVQPGSAAPTRADADTMAPDNAGLSAGPDPLQSSDYRLPDEARDAFVALPATAHEFTQTNRALTESSAYRVLTHLAWRQPVLRANGATPIAITGGRQFGEHHELAGTLTIRFNQSRDRVLLDTNLWLARFSTQPPPPGQGPEPAPALKLPTAPGVDVEAGAGAGGNDDSQQPRFYVTEVFPMQDSRAMRSNEFHYLDHPAIGVLVQVFPYEPPAAPVNAFPGSALPL